MDGLKELVEAFSARIKSPIVGSIALAFIAINWRPVFFVFFSGEPANDKFLYFTENTTGLSLYLYPVIAGLAFALLVPWINFWGAKAIEAPVSKHRNMQLDAAHVLAEKKARHAIDMETVDAEYRKAILESAKVDQEIKDADIDEDVRIVLKEKFRGPILGPSREEFQSSISSNEEEDNLSDTAVDILVQAGKEVSGELVVSEGENKYQVWFGSEDGNSLKLNGRREFLEVQEAVDELRYFGYLEERQGNWMAITKAGYEYLDTLPKTKPKA